MADRYEAWRITYQSSEQAARAAFAEMQRLAAALEASREDAERWRMCNSEHDLGDGEAIRCHVNVGVNVWKDGAWAAFDEVSPDELRQVLGVVRGEASREENGNG